MYNYWPLVAGAAASVVQSDLFGASVAGGATGVFSLGGGSGAGIDYTPWAVAGVFSDFWFNLGEAIGGTVVLTILIDGVETALSITVPDGGFGVVSNTVDSVSVAAGALVSIQVTNNTPNPIENLSGFSFKFVG